MIVSNNSRLFGLAKIGVVKCPTFGCMVNTAPDGMFKGSSTLFKAFDADQNWSLSNQLLVAKALLRPNLSKKERSYVHDVLLEQLDLCGNKGYGLDKAIDEVFAIAKASGAIVDSINNAHELLTSDDAKRASTPNVSALNKLFDFGQIKLDRKINDMTGLEEFSRLEYTGLKRRFKGEKIYNAPLVSFLGRSWQSMLSTVHGQIWKIALLISLPTKQEADAIAMTTHQYCKERLGPPSEQTAMLFVWDTKDGNVVIQNTTKGVDGFLVSMALTSGAVSKFQLL